MYEHEATGDRSFDTARIAEMMMNDDEALKALKTMQTMQQLSQLAAGSAAAGFQANSGGAAGGFGQFGGLVGGGYAGAGGQARARGRLDMNTLSCFHCGKAGHFANNCPAKKEQKKDETRTS